MRCFVFACTLLATLTFGSQALAIMRPISTEELALRSDLVVEGTTGAVRSYWNAAHTRIFSSVDIAIAEVVRGESAAQTVTVQYLGGQVGELVLQVEDMEPFAGGERVVLFLTRNDGSVSPFADRTSAPGGYSLVGSSQGRFVVGADKVARKGGFTVAGESTEVDLEIPLEDLKEKIRRAR